MSLDNEHWGHVVEEPVAYEKWHRSWRQEINTAFGQVPTLTAWMETVTRYADGRLEFNRWNTPIELNMAELAESELTSALAVRSALTELIGSKLEAILNPPPPVEPPVDTDPPAEPPV